MQRDRFDILADHVRNWGRWSDADRRGTLNLIDPAALLRASREVSVGKAFNLGLPFNKHGPQLDGYRFNPMLYATALGKGMVPDSTACMSDDVIHMPLQCATQWDALGHVHYDGRMYNGCAAADDLGTDGSSCNGVEHLARPGIVSRGILLDIARLYQVDALPADHGISPHDLDEACAAEGVAIAPGDIVLVRTGHIRRFTVDGDRQAFNGISAGLLPECAGWLHDRGAAAVAADNMAVEQLGADTFRGGMALPLHMLCLRDMGMPLGEMFDLEALAQDCAADGRYGFLLSAPPLEITGAFGSPVNPVALK